VEIPVTTLDQFCAKNGVERIDILKMDIQGAELPALRGASRLLREGRIGLIFTEVEFVPLYEQQGLYHHIAEFLEQHDFELHNFYDLNVNREVGQLLWADAIFLSSKGEGRS
jgi:hypothetical protein